MGIVGDAAEPGGKVRTPGKPGERWWRMGSSASGEVTWKESETGLRREAENKCRKGGGRGQTETRSSRTRKHREGDGARL